MKKLIPLAPALLLLWALSSCTSYNYYQAAINKTNMSGYHTFAWMPHAKSSNRSMGSMADMKIKEAATTALVAKGLQINQQHPDLIINYTRVVGTGTYTTYYTPYYGGYWGWGWGWGWYRPWYYWGSPFAYPGAVTYADKSHYREGTLIIDLIDPRTRKIVWRGFGVGEVHHDPQKDVEDLPRVVDGILSQLQVIPYAQPRMRQS